MYNVDEQDRFRSPELRLIEGGKGSKLEELFSSCYQSSLSLALKFVGNLEDASDVIQESYIRACKGISNFRGESSFETWFHTIVVNTAKSFRAVRSKRSVREGSELFDEPGESQNVDDDSFSATVIDIERAMAKLPPRFKSVVILRDFYGMSHREIAERLSITEGTAKVWLHRARKKIVEVLVAKRNCEDDFYQDLERGSSRSNKRVS
ncbi:RNA polymerase sigma-70 factor, ECF subfamily [Ferrithrix thermotolerans DSM 19514]|uniref:RNA polymerase sigma-70 factor, ECF subfamily n=1 Tax=Ferrithrix thermotolerans DSM 19514 TaxID=1121881 RepID=A0A1M4SRB8_9ACTN|nr:RNA polymerase sigma factor [Ferrithrix thermotolerans]SHE34692.1 RNA polymerase sigma-70 factor, ECF subfamily [Ferrithrix thermotolerans DSM 19514]